MSLRPFEHLFAGHEDQGWDDVSKMTLVYDFLEEDAKRDPSLWDRLEAFLQGRSDEENAECLEDPDEE